MDLQPPRVLAQKPHSTVHQWIKEGKTTRQEIQASLAFFFNIGLNKKANIKAYWDVTNSSQATPWFPQHFSRDRVFLLLKFLHFSDSANQPEPNHPDHKLYKIKNLIEHFNRVAQDTFHPYETYSIDESMIGYKGKTPHLRQFMPNKRHARFGVKLWCLCDTLTGYTAFFEVYKDAIDGQDRTVEGPIYNLVFRMLQGANCLNLGHHLGLDNYFSSPKLFIDLYNEHTTATGTVRVNRKGLPKQVLKQSLQNQEVAERRKGPLLCVAYKDGNRRPVLLSTVARAGYDNVVNRRGQNIRKPSIVQVYNKAMGGVDLSDAKLYTYLAERRTLKWTKKVFISLIGRALLNSYILYSKNVEGRVLNRHSYNISVIESFVGDYRPSKIPRKRRSMQGISP